MDLPTTTDDFRNRADLIVPQKSRKNKLKLYCEGLKAKIYQTDFALSEITALENQADTTVTTSDPNAPPISLKVEFFCDSFWTFLCSCLDVLSQILNQALKLKLDEHQVSFNRIEKEIAKKFSGTPYHKAVLRCVNSNSYTNLLRYRNCSIHRRQIYIKEEIKIVRQPTGYSTTTAGSFTVERTLCDNPLQIAPSTKRARHVPDYLKTTRDKIYCHIESILKATVAQK